MGVFPIIRNTVVTETCGPKTQDFYKCTKAHHSDPAHSASTQGTNSSTNSTYPHMETPNQYINHHTLLQDVWKLSTRKVKIISSRMGACP